MISKKQLFVVSLWIHLVSSSVELQKVDDPNDIRIAKKLVKYLDSKINVIPKIEIRSNEVEDEVVNKDVKVKETHKPTINHNDAHRGGLKKIVIKRIVPHGLQVPKYEHDMKYDTLYKPLFRVHKGRNKYPIIEESENMKDLENKIKLTNIPTSPDATIDKHLKSYFHNDEYLLQPVHNLKWHQTKSKQGYKDAGNYLNFLLKHLNLKGGDYEKFLRSPSLVKSGEEEVPAVSLAPPTPSTSTPKPKWLPRYPAWNYWTYEKHIYQDACPGLLINVGGICTWIPPH